MDANTNSAPSPKGNKPPRSKPKRTRKNLKVVEVLLSTFVGAVLTFGATFLTNHYSNKEQFEKERRDKRESYFDDYFKNLNKRFSICMELISQKVMQPVDEKAVKLYNNKLEQERWEMNLNREYDSVQFHRFLDDATSRKVSKIDSDLNYYFQKVEGALPKDQDSVASLRQKQAPYFKRIKTLEQEVYRAIDGN